MDRLLLARARYVVAIAALVAGFFVFGLAAQAPTAAASGSVDGSITPAAGSLLAAPTTADTGRINVFDALVIARVHVRAVGTVDLAPAVLGDLWEGSASCCGEGSGTSTTPSFSVVATNTATRIGDDVVAAGDDAFTHSYSYHPRLRERGLQDPVGHNFPYSYDDVILRSAPVTQADGSLLYRVPGSINGKDGFFEIAVNPTTQTIFHRTFVGG